VQLLDLEATRPGTCTTTTTPCSRCAVWRPLRESVDSSTSSRKLSNLQQDAHEVGEPHLRAFRRHQLLESPSHGAALPGFLIPSGNCATSSLLCPLNFLFPPLATGVTSSPLATHVAATWSSPSVSPRDDLAWSSHAPVIQIYHAP
jgi:hypothetical protein